MVERGLLLTLDYIEIGGGKCADSKDRIDAAVVRSTNS
jgi:hypothetical protein